MPVAVRLVEVLTLVTLLAILTGFSLFVVFAEQMLYVAMVLFEPIIVLCNFVLYYTERLLLFSLYAVMRLTNSMALSEHCCDDMF